MTPLLDFGLALMLIDIGVMTGWMLRDILPTKLIKKTKHGKRKTKHTAAR